MSASLYVRELGTGEVVYKVEVTNITHRQLDRVMSGMLRNMNTDRYYVDDDEARKVADEREDNRGE